MSSTTGPNNRRRRSSMSGSWSPDSGFAGGTPSPPIPAFESLPDFPFVGGSQAVPEGGGDSPILRPGAQRAEESFSIPTFADFRRATNQLNTLCLDSASWSRGAD